MNVRELALAVHAESGRALAAVDPAEVERLLERIAGAKRVFLAGAGRSGLAVRAFAMRLMHLGLEAHVLGEVTTPAIAAGDLLVVGSGSGETASLAAAARKARSLGAEVALLTIHPDSTIGRESAAVVRIPAVTPKAAAAAAAAVAAEGTVQSIQPMGSLFEQALWLLFDTLVMALMERSGTDASRMFARHANLE